MIKHISIIIFILIVHALNFPNEASAQSDSSRFLDYRYPNVEESTRALGNFNPLSSGSRVSSNRFEDPKLAFISAQKKHANDLAKWERDQRRNERKRLVQLRKVRAKERAQRLKEREKFKKELEKEKAKEKKRLRDIASGNIEA